MRGTTRMGHFSLALSIYVKFCAKVEPLTKKMAEPEFSRPAKLEFGVMEF
jgi:hypothetical protein